ncbi:MAG: glycosyltransferase family 39 protein [Deltaproteobacteria bacterium]|nr:glycosyltransferase family 39 protein [Deltaproteobacteria bacterium]MBW2103874.1 glycosyltransferase family 39 protein [Deltaproteobacteria bacterium]
MKTKMSDPGPSNLHNSLDHSIRKRGRRAFTIVLLNLLIILPGVFLAWQALFSPEISFVHTDARNPWIMYPLEIRTKEIYNRGTPAVRFSKTFQVKEPRPDLILRLRAMKAFTLRLNGRLIPESAYLSRGRHWKEATRVRLTPYLNQKENAVEITVRNPTGPSLLCIVGEQGQDLLNTDTSWLVSRGSGDLKQAIPANDTRGNPEVQTLPGPLYFLWQEKGSLLTLFVLSCAAFLLGRHFLKGPTGGRLPLYTLAVLTVGWVYLFLNKFAPLTHKVGFDVAGHIYYILHVAQKGTIPLANQGWSMHHPPLFYLLSSGLLKAVNAYIPNLSIFSPVKFLVFLSGLGNLFVTYFFARRFFERDPFKTTLAVLIAGILPMNLYMSAYISNEPLNGFLLGLSILVTFCALTSPRTSWSVVASAGILFGLSLLTKYTAWVVAPVAFLFIAYKLMAIDKVPWKTVWIPMAVFVICMLGVSGWYYARNVAAFGRPLVFNWELISPAHAWWQQPGFHTPQYFTAFGESLRQPFFASFHSFWDGIYSTVWGDALVGGKVFFAGRHSAWNYTFMSAVYPLALPATFATLLGLFRTVRRITGPEDSPEWAGLLFLVCLVAVFFWATIHYSLKAPMYGTVKAFFALCLMGPLCVMTASGLSAIDGFLRFHGRLVLRTLFYGWLGTLIGAIILTYWV